MKVNTPLLEISSDSETTAYEPGEIPESCYSLLDMLDVGIAGLLICIFH